MPTERQIICTVCPVGCVITVKDTAAATPAVSGNQCPRGAAYASAEFLHPLRILTATVKVSGGSIPVVSVRSNRPVPREKLFACMKLLKKLRLTAPVDRYQVLIPDILGTGAAIVTTGSVASAKSSQA